MSNDQNRAILRLLKSYSHPELRDIPLTVVMQALADPCRMTILRRLLDADGKELACHEFGLKVSKATQSHHFDTLRAAGLTRTEAKGTECMTSLRTRELNKRFPGLLKLVAAS